MLITLVGFSQNVNSGTKAVVKDSLSKPKLSILKNKYLFLNTFISEKNLHTVLIESKNEQIIQLVKESKSRKTAQCIVGFMSIPFAGTAILLINKSFQKSQPVFSNTGGYMYEKLDGNYFFLGVLSLTAAIVCPFSSVHYRKQRKKYNTLAIELYNKKY